MVLTALSPERVLYGHKLLLQGAVVLQGRLFLKHPDYILFVRREELGTDGYFIFTAGFLKHPHGAYDNTPLGKIFKIIWQFMKYPYKVFLTKVL